MGDYLKQKQIKNVPDPTQWDFEFIEYYHKAFALFTDPDKKSQVLGHIKCHEAQRDYTTPSLRNINHLVQIDEKPNQELKEPRCEIYKISISFKPHRES